MTATSSFHPDEVDTWALGLSGSLHGDLQAVNTAIITSDIPLSTLTLLGWCACINLLSSIAERDGADIADVLPEWLLHLRDVLGVDS